jgi:hypothetical protein
MAVAALFAFRAIVLVLTPCNLIKTKTFGDLASAVMSEAFLTLRAVVVLFAQSHFLVRWNR